MMLQQDLDISRENKKLGNIHSFSLPAKASCPGASEWCKVNCYAIGWPLGFFNKTRYANNYERSKSRWFEKLMIQRIRLYANNTKDKYLAFRIHVSGDFYDNAYIDKWIHIVKASPRVHFFSYTRSWTLPHLFLKLEELRALPNMQLFASVDSSIKLNPPPRWRKAWIEDDTRAVGLICPEQVGFKQDCTKCKFCYMGKQGNVVFKIH